ncbi:hypothetical protein MKX01_022723 [Papaver californicum]|nr:hypothetical protein MKX01_022723 [Papaver californicum]
MATTVSAWAKPGAWALEAEENDAAEELIQQQEKEKEKEKSKMFQFRHQQKEEQQPLSDFPSLSAAVATKTKKKKAVPISLSEFQTGSSNSSSQPAAKGLTTDELLSLPTGPRERTAEELERGSGRLGGGFRSYGSNREGGSDESRGGRSGGFNRDRENTRDSGPSRADESGDWGAKKSMGAPSFERRERGSGGGFFDSQSRADDTDDWGAAKRSAGASSFERRERGAGGEFPDTGSRADESDSWVSNKSRVSSMPPPRRVGGGFERDRREGFGFQKENSNGSGPDSDTWGKKREEGSPTTTGNGARPKLVLNPRTLSPTNGEEQSGSMTKTKGSNPFGEARPREEILAAKGQDYKKIDEQFDSIKIKENGSNGTGPTDGSSSFGKKSFGNDNGSESERSWRKPESIDVSPPPSWSTAIKSWPIPKMLAD